MPSTEREHHTPIDIPSYPHLRQVVLDCTESRRLAEFYRHLLGLEYRSGDEQHGTEETEPDWLVLTSTDGHARIAFQRVDALHRVTWPEGPVSQQLHLDLTVPTRAELDVHHARALELGAHLLSDRSDDPAEPLRVYADPEGHPFCLFVAPDVPV